MVGTFCATRTVTGYLCFCRDKQLEIRLTKKLLEPLKTIFSQNLNITTIEFLTRN